MANIIFGPYQAKDNDPTEKINLEFGLFFDGTANNKDNSDARLANKNSEEYKAFMKYGADKESSYYNDWSNVGRMWKFYKKENAIYIEGIGTGKDQINLPKLDQFASDRTLALAVGSGPTGIRKKVMKACEHLAQKIVKSRKELNNKQKINKIYLDLFGFSRGAAAARNFAYEIHRSTYKAVIYSDFKTGVYNVKTEDGLFVDDNPKYLDKGYFPAGGYLAYLLKKSGIIVKPSQIVIRFMGLYDTVSAYSKFILNANFENDVKQLSLNNIKAEKIVHFTARDEHRENFSLTRVPYGIEKSFPGVHSDIGGGYNSGVEVVDQVERDWFAQYNWSGLADLNRYKQRLINEGWYEEDQLEIVSLLPKGPNLELKTIKDVLTFPAKLGLKMVDVINPFNYLKGTRSLRKEYSYIPLQFMTEFAALNGLTLLSKDKIFNEFKLTAHPVLEKTRELLEKYILGNTFKEPLHYEEISEKNTFIKVNKEYIEEQLILAALRKKYIHWSANRKGIGFDPNKNSMWLKNTVDQPNIRKEF